MEWEKHWIIGKSVINILKQDIIYASGSLQTCAGIESGIEAAVHSMATKFQEKSSEALLLVDASNAFNSMNREKSLRPVNEICPMFHQYLKTHTKYLHINIFQNPSKDILFGLRREPLKGTIVLWHTML